MNSWIRVFSIFIAITPSHLLCDIYRRTLQRLNSKEPYPSSERGRKFRRRLCTSSVQREIRPVSRRSRAVTAKKCTKKRDARAKLLLWLLNLFAFVTFSLPSPSSYLKVPINRGVRKLKGRRRRRKHHLKSESGPFLTSLLLTPSHSIRQLLANFCGFDFLKAVSRSGRR